MSHTRIAIVLGVLMYVLWLVVPVHGTGGTPLSDRLQGSENLRGHVRIGVTTWPRTQSFDVDSGIRE